MHGGRSVRVHVHGHSYSCSRVTRPCPGVTRDSLDFNHSLRGLSCLLQKHRLRYTIKPPAQFREDSRLFHRSFSRSFDPRGGPILSPRSLTLRLSFRSHRWLYPVIIVVPAVVVTVSSRQATRYHRGKRGGHLIVALNYPHTTHISTLAPLLTAFARLLSRSFNAVAPRCLCEFLCISRG